MHSLSLIINLNYIIQLITILINYFTILKVLPHFSKDLYLFTIKKASSHNLM